MRNIWLICYDISNDKRRYRLSRLLNEYGERIQYSAFEVVIAKQDFKRVRQQILTIIEPSEDKINYYFLCRWCHSKTLLQGHAKLSDFTEYSCIC